MSISYITNEAGEKTAVIVPIDEWNLTSAGQAARKQMTYKSFDSTKISGRWNRASDEDEVAIIREMRRDRTFD
jgi:hypothetical protein